MDIYKDIGYRIAELRSKSGLKQAELAEILGISREMMVYYEGGKRKIKFETLINIADYFNVSIDYFLGRTKVTTKNTDLQEVCDYIGLSENAVDNLHNFTEMSVPCCAFSAGDIFNKLCESGLMFELCQHILSYYELSELVLLYKYKIENMKSKNEDYREYEELSSVANKDVDYFKWNITNFVNEMVDFILKSYKKDTNRDISKYKQNINGCLDEEIDYFKNVQHILERHKKECSVWSSLCEHKNNAEEFDGNGKHNTPKE